MNDSTQETPQKGISWKRFAITALICVPILALFHFGLNTEWQHNLTSKLPGKPAPDFNLKPIGKDSTISLEAMRGHYVVVNFWATWCGPCRAEHSELVQTANTYQPLGVKFVGILDGDDPSNASRFFAEVGAVPYPTLVQDSTHTGIEYGLNGVPETFIIDSRGMIRYSLKGAWGSPIRDGDPPIHLAVVLDSLMAVDKGVSEK